MERAKIPPKDKRELEQDERKNNARYKEARERYIQAKGLA
jgi:hypothetical protein